MISANISKKKVIVLTNSVGDGDCDCNCWIGLMFLLLFTIHLKRQIVVSLHLNQIAFIRQKNKKKTKVFK